MAYGVKLEIFEGPLDLLLYLIQKHELDVHDIPITLITEQYLEHMDMLSVLNLEVAGEFLVMATMLMRIKSKTLLPIDQVEEDAAIEEDPREELVQKLLEYMKFKDVAGQMRVLEETRSDSIRRHPEPIEFDDSDSPFINISIFDLITAFSRVLKEMPKDVFHRVIKDEFTVAEKVEEILGRLKSGESVQFTTLFTQVKNKLEAITVFLALLELIRLKEVSFIQSKNFDDIDIASSESIDEDDPHWNRAMSPGLDTEVAHDEHGIGGGN
ncbi:MAG: segregation and condensation protein A [Candidatus Omnitrophota bacterium]|jgi:segregation and condensation protein A